MRTATLPHLKTSPQKIIMAATRMARRRRGETRILAPYNTSLLRILR
jgi:hypothetical protein